MKEIVYKEIPWAVGVKTNKEVWGSYGRGNLLPFSKTHLGSSQTPERKKWHPQADKIPYGFLERLPATV